MLVAFLAVFVLLLAVWPLGRLFAEALGSGESGRSFGLIREAMASPSVWRAFWNTLETSSASVAVSVVLGVPLALAISLLKIRNRVALTFLMLSPLLIPSQIMALAWIELMGSSSPILGLLGLAPAPGEMNPLYSPGGIVWLMGVEHMPLVFSGGAGQPDDPAGRPRRSGPDRRRGNASDRDRRPVAPDNPRCRRGCEPCLRGVRRQLRRTGACLVFLDAIRC